MIERAKGVPIAAVAFWGTMALSVSAADIAQIYGHWEPAEKPCMGSDQAWTISKQGASPFESTCILKSVRRTGNTFKLTQSCSTEGDSHIMIVDIKHISAKSLEIYGFPYRRCPKPIY